MRYRIRRAKEKFKAILARNGIRARSRTRVIKRFTAKLGFIYFGHVDQHVDEHEVVRGFSVSPTHKDDNYAVGSYEDYDMLLVDRFDVTVHDTGEVEKHTWFIMEIKLHTPIDIPHLFLMPNHQSNIHYQKLFVATRSLEPVETLETHTSDFHSRYTLYASPSQLPMIEEYFSEDITRTIAAHFWPLAIEVYKNAVYVYSAEKRLTEQYLEAMIKNGTWLSQMLDKNDLDD